MVGWLLLFLSWIWIAIYIGPLIPDYGSRPKYSEPLVEKFVIKTYEEQYCQNDETKKVRVFKSVDQVKID